MLEIFKVFKNITGINQTELSKITSIARQTINSAINNSSVNGYKPSEMLKKSILMHMYKITVERKEEEIQKYNLLLQAIDKKGKE